VIIPCAARPEFSESEYNVKRRKVIKLMSNDKVLYRCSNINSGENTAAWLAQRLLAVVRLLIDEHGARAY